jgi:hypothetical protein
MYCNKSLHFSAHYITLSTLMTLVFDVVSRICITGRAPEGASITYLRAAWRVDGLSRSGT